MPRPLKFGDGILVVAEADQDFAKLEAKLQVGRVAFDALSRFLEEELGALSLHFLKLARLLGVYRDSLGLEAINLLKPGNRACPIV